MQARHSTQSTQATPSVSTVASFREAGFPEANRYARCVEISRRTQWDIDRDLLRGRRFDFSRKFLPDSLSHIDRIGFLTPEERRLLSQIQGRTYANMFALVERFIGAKMIEVGHRHALGDQIAVDALVRFTGDELKHQELFRRVECMVAEGMPEGYRFLPRPNEVAAAVLGKSSWAVLALICHIEFFVLAHYRQSIAPDADLSELFKDIMLFHARDEAQHAVIDELEWMREDRRLSVEERDRAVDDLIDLVAAVDGLLQIQAEADVDYFTRVSARRFTGSQKDGVRGAVLAAYRWQYIGSGVQDPRFTGVLGKLIDERQSERIGRALEPILH